MSEEARQPEEKKFATVDEVIEYLVDVGWVAKKPTIYRHRQQGKFLPKDDGQFRQKDIDRYAKTFLKRQDTGKKQRERIDELQQKKYEEELETEREKRRKIRRENDFAEGKLIDRKEVENWLAGRAGILEAGLKYWIESSVAAWTRRVEGDIKLAGDLRNAMIRDLDEHINSYAQQKEFELVIDGDEEEGDGDE